MSVKDKTRVGSKGEILPRLPLREIAGLKPGDKVEIEAQPGQLIVRKILSIDEVFDLPIIAKYDEGELNEILKDEKQIQERIVD